MIASGFLERLFRKRALWTIALYIIDNKRDIFGLDKLEPFAFVGERGVRVSRKYQSTVADPFLFDHEGKVYLFYEVKTDFDIGEIHAKSIDSEGHVADYGSIIKEDFHMSYPQVFDHGGRIWMIPETAASGKVWLYGCNKFPDKWERKQILIDEEIVDASVIINNDGIYLLGTDRAGSLRLFHAGDLNECFVDTGVVVTNDKSISRNAGRPLSIDGNLYRFAQNCKNAYGECIHVLNIEKIDKKEFSEELVVDGLFKNKPEWMALGYHHISLAPINDKYIVAIDGMRPDKFINTMTLAYFKLFGANS